MHLLTHKAVFEYIGLAGANGLWRRVHCKKTCLRTLFDLGGHISVQLGTYFPITSTGANELWGECTLKDVTRTCRMQLLTYEAVSMCITVIWPTCLHASCST